jgi:hypothetical protein
MLSPEEFKREEKLFRLKQLKGILRSQSPESTKLEFVNLLIELEHCSNSEAIESLKHYIRLNNKGWNDKYKK